MAQPRTSDTRQDPLPQPSSATRLAPWSPLIGLRDEIDRLFSGRELGRWFDQPKLGLAGPERLVPAMDVTETSTAYAVQLEIPGIDPVGVTITIANGMLVIAGEKTEESEDTEQNYHVSERRWGSFQRAIRMPEHVDEAKIEATSAKGVLTVMLPKSDKGRSADRKIPVKAG